MSLVNPSNGEPVELSVVYFDSKLKLKHNSLKLILDRHATGKQNGKSRLMKLGKSNFTAMTSRFYVRSLILVLVGHLF